ncbi:MAG: hypothetical protein QXR19_14260 [Candidatus Jordarchaeaceae archaeon]
MVRPEPPGALLGYTPSQVFPADSWTEGASPAQEARLLPPFETLHFTNLGQDCSRRLLIHTRNCDQEL